MLLNSKLAPTLTICVCTYNRVRELKRCLTAISSQISDSKLLKSVETIIVDDHSDNQQEVRKICDGVHASFIAKASNLGLADSRNRGIYAGRAPFFTFCDDDDVFPDGYLKVIQTAIERLDIADAVVVMSPKYKKSWELLYGQSNKPITFRQAILSGFTPPVASQIYSTAAIRSAGGYNPAIKSGVDHDLWFRLAENPAASLTVVWSEITPIIGKDPGSERMTTDRSRRLERVKHSIDIWSVSLERWAPKGFVEHLKNEYEKNIASHITLDLLRQKSLGHAISFVMKEKCFVSFIFFCYSRITRRINQFEPYE